MKIKMSGLDAFYTPMNLANRLVSYISEYNIKTVIDFCVGDGNLLKAARNQFNDALFFGTDISQDAINKITNENNNWHLSVCDFRDDYSVSKVPFLKNTKFDLIILNPPFSCKGSIVEHVEVDGIKYKVSTAMMFIMRAIKFLSPIGGIYAILPISCVYSQKDRTAWQYLQKNYNACILDEPERIYFDKKCSPNIVLIYLGHTKKKVYHTNINADFSELEVNNIIRGNIRMQNITYYDSHDAIPLIHTTNLQKGKLVNLKCVLPPRLTIHGYGVVIPRVCNPNQQKIALLDGKKTYALSDCVIVLCTSTMDAAKQIRTHILNNWSTFVNLYKGTGAKYTTLEKVKTLFWGNKKF